MNKVIWSVIIFAALTACDTHTSKNDKTDVKRDLFKQLAFAEAGLDFPGSMDKLNNCQNKQDMPCLRVYESFHKAKNELLKMPTPKALELTLHDLRISCVMEPSADAKYKCTGALIALYYFNEVQDDKKIRPFLTNLTTEIREEVLKRSISMNISWLVNRTDNGAWLSWLETEKVDQSIKTNVIRRLNTSESDLKSVYKVI